MSQKILRTMQDDLKEAKEKKSTSRGFLFRKKENSKEEVPKESLPPIQNDQELNQTKETERPILDAIEKETTEEIKDELQNDNTKAEPKPEFLSKEASSTSNTQENELRNLISRVSKSMEGPANNQAKPITPERIDKDKELKDLIARMSRNLKQEEEVIKKEIEEPAKSSEIPFENEKNQQEGNDSYWEKLHDTLKQPGENTPEQKVIDEIRKEIKLTNENQLSAQEIKKVETITASQPKSSETNNTSSSTVQKDKASRAEETGVITPKISDSTEEIQQNIAKKVSTYKEDGSYVTPENRLIFGKQEYYSSLHKRVKPKTKEEDLESVKNAVKKEETRLTEEEEKKMLRKHIIKKYGIRFFALPWGKIIVFSALFLGTLAVSLYYVLPRLVPTEPESAQLIAGQEIDKIEQKISKEVIAEQSQIATINYFDANLEPWKSYENGSIIKLQVNYDGTEVTISKDQALKTILEQNNFNKIPQKFKDLTTQEYKILVFKNNDSLRLGIAMKYDKTKEAEFRETMLAWEGTNIQSERMYNIMKKLFVSDKLIEKDIPSFQPAMYNDVELKYINLPDTGTSMDYFIYDDIIVFATSKDTSFQMIDIVKN